MLKAARARGPARRAARAARPPAPDAGETSAGRHRGAGAAAGGRGGRDPSRRPYARGGDEGRRARGVELVLARERALGRNPVEQAFNNPGFDILSTDATARHVSGSRSRPAWTGAKDFFVTHNEVMTGKNAAPRYRLALVRVDPRGSAARRGPLPRRLRSQPPISAILRPPEFVATGPRCGLRERCLPDADDFPGNARRGSGQSAPDRWQADPASGGVGGRVARLRRRRGGESLLGALAPDRCHH